MIPLPQPGGGGAHGLCATSPRLSSRTEELEDRLQALIDATKDELKTELRALETAVDAREEQRFKVLWAELKSEAVVREAGDLEVRQLAERLAVNSDEDRAVPPSAVAPLEPSLPANIPSTDANKLFERVHSGEQALRALVAVERTARVKQLETECRAREAHHAAVQERFACQEKWLEDVLGKHVAEAIAREDAAKQDFAQRLVSVEVAWKAALRNGAACEAMSGDASTWEDAAGRATAPQPTSPLEPLSQAAPRTALQRRLEGNMSPRLPPGSGVMRRYVSPPSTGFDSLSTLQVSSSAPTLHAPAEACNLLQKRLETLEKQLREELTKESVHRAVDVKCLQDALHKQQNHPKTYEAEDLSTRAARDHSIQVVRQAREAALEERLEAHHHAVQERLAEQEKWLEETLSKHTRDAPEQTPTVSGSDRDSSTCERLEGLERKVLEEPRAREAEVEALRREFRMEADERQQRLAERLDEIELQLLECGGSSSPGTPSELVGELERSLQSELAEMHEHVAEEAARVTSILEEVERLRGSAASTRDVIDALERRLRDEVNTESGARQAAVAELRGLCESVNGSSEGLGSRITELSTKVSEMRTLVSDETRHRGHLEETASAMQAEQAVRHASMWESTEDLRTELAQSTEVLRAELCKEVSARKSEVTQLQELIVPRVVQNEVSPGTALAEHEAQYVLMRERSRSLEQRLQEGLAEEARARGEEMASLRQGLAVDEAAERESRRNEETRWHAELEVCKAALRNRVTELDQSIRRAQGEQGEEVRTLKAETARMRESASQIAQMHGTHLEVLRQRTQGLEQQLIEGLAREADSRREQVARLHGSSDSEAVARESIASTSFRMLVDEARQTMWGELQVEISASRTSTDSIKEMLLNEIRQETTAREHALHRVQGLFEKTSQTHTVGEAVLHETQYAKLYEEIVICKERVAEVHSAMHSRAPCQESNDVSGDCQAQLAQFAEELSACRARIEEIRSPADSQGRNAVKDLILEHMATEQEMHDSLRGGERLLEERLCDLERRSVSQSDVSKETKVREQEISRLRDAIESETTARHALEERLAGEREICGAHKEMVQSNFGEVREVQEGFDTSVQELDRRIHEELHREREEYHSSIEALRDQFNSECIFHKSASDAISHSLCEEIKSRRGKEEQQEDQIREVRNLIQEEMHKFKHKHHESEISLESTAKEQFENMERLLIDRWRHDLTKESVERSAQSSELRAQVEERYLSLEQRLASEGKQAPTQQLTGHSSASDGQHGALLLHEVVRNIREDVSRESAARESQVAELRRLWSAEADAHGEHREMVLPLDAKVKQLIAKHEELIDAHSAHQDAVQQLSTKHEDHRSLTASMQKELNAHQGIVESNLVPLRDFIIQQQAENQEECGDLHKRVDEIQDTLEALDGILRQATPKDKAVRRCSSDMSPSLRQQLQAESLPSSRASRTSESSTKGSGPPRFQTEERAARRSSEKKA